jgi:hypothetical protein
MNRFTSIAVTSIFLASMVGCARPPAEPDRAVAAEKLTLAK